MNISKIIAVIILGFISIACSGLWEDDVFEYYPDDISKITFLQGNSQEKEIIGTVVEKKAMATIVSFIDLRAEVPMSKQVFKYHLELFTKGGKILYISFENDGIRYLNKQYELNEAAFEFLETYFKNHE